MFLYPNVSRFVAAPETKSLYPNVSRFVAAPEAKFLYPNISPSHEASQAKSKVLRPPPSLFLPKQPGSKSVMGEWRRHLPFG